MLGTLILHTAMPCATLESSLCHIQLTFALDLLCITCPFPYSILLVISYLHVKILMEIQKEKNHMWYLILLIQIIWFLQAVFSACKHLPPSPIYYQLLNVVVIIIDLAWTVVVILREGLNQELRTHNPLSLLTLLLLLHHAISQNLFVSLFRGLNCSWIWS
jgi:hypothetical protein